MSQQKNRQWFFEREVVGGFVLFLATVVSLICANSPLAASFQAFQTYDLAQGHLSQPIPLDWFVNDVLMTLFFLMVGLEIRREIVQGELNTRGKAVLPALAAFGGMVVPAAIYLLINPSDPIAYKGFGIPVATDIAFTLGILALLGKRVPVSLKAFLTALAIFDDIGAIIVIALFYGHGFSVLYFLLALLIAAIMLALKVAKFEFSSVSFLLAALLWYCTYYSGIHVTLAGVVVAFLWPTGSTKGQAKGAIWLEHLLQPYVAFLIVPLFGFLNAGVSLLELDLAHVMTPISLGIILGLFVGKQLGVFGMTWLAVKLRLAPRPRGASWPSIYGASVLCGVGFTMSLFVGALAFMGLDPSYMQEVKIGVLLGSGLSGLMGYALLYLSAQKQTTP